MRAWIVWLVVAVVVAVAGCGDDRGRAARERYNAGVAKLEGGALDEAEREFLAARDLARFDDEVRFRATFDLASVAIARAEAAANAQPPKSAEAIAAYDRARTWLTDAVRRRPDDADARANLERVEARLLALVDAAGAGANKLEARLDRAIATQRSLRDATRGLWNNQAAAGGDPLAGKDEFEAAAVRQRTLAAEVGEVADLAGDEITAIGGKAEDERSDEEKVRLVQLQNLDLYVADARKAMTDARRNLHELQGELAHGRTAAALESLKRAREQLLDPITVLQGVARDQLELVGYLEVLAAPADQRRALPTWLTARAQGGEQIDLRARLEEVKARLDAVPPPAAAPTPTPTPANPADPANPAAPVDPANPANPPPPAAPADPQAAQAAKLAAQIAAARPALEEASAAMKLAADRLGGDDVAGGTAAGRDAVLALARAIEQFLPLRQLVDLTLEEQRGVVAALAPATDGTPESAAQSRGRLARVTDGTAKNRARLARMTGLIADELAAAEAAAQAPADPNAPANPDPNAAPSEAAQALERAKQLYGQAEALRAEAERALADLATVAAGGKGAPPLDSARAAEAKLVELQRLFFSVVEHLRELVREQGETRDDTTAAQGEDDAGRAARLPGLVDRQAGHVQLAEAIASALAAQADAAAQGGAAQPAPGAPSPEIFGQAATEVRTALGAMQDASATLTQARDQAQQMSFDMNPALASQATALEHLENALRLLQPPPPEQDQQDQQQDQQQQDQEQQDQQQQDQQQQQQQQSTEQQLQQLREREAERQRERREREQQRGGDAPVDKDW